MKKTALFAPIGSILAVQIATAGVASAEDLTRESRAPRLEEVTLGELLPTALLDQMTQPWHSTFELMERGDEGAIWLTTELTVDERPGVIFSLSYLEQSDGVFATMYDSAASMIDDAREGKPVVSGPIDLEFPDGLPCVGYEDVANINCRVGERAMLQFTANVMGMVDGEAQFVPLAYADLKEIFATVPFERFEAIEAAR